MNSGEPTDVIYHNEADHCLVRKAPPGPHGGPVGTDAFKVVEPRAGCEYFAGDVVFASWNCLSVVSIPNGYYTILHAAGRNALATVHLVNTQTAGWVKGTQLKLNQTPSLKSRCMELFFSEVPVLGAVDPDTDAVLRSSAIVDGKPFVFRLNNVHKANLLLERWQPTSSQDASSAQLTNTLARSHSGVSSSSAAHQSAVSSSSAASNAPSVSSASTPQELWLHPAPSAVSPQDPAPQFAPVPASTDAMLQKLLGMMDEQRDRAEKAAESSAHMSEAIAKLQEQVEDLKTGKGRKGTAAAKSLTSAGPTAVQMLDKAFSDATDKVGVFGAQVAVTLLTPESLRPAGFKKKLESFVFTLPSVPVTCLFDEEKLPVNFQPSEDFWGTQCSKEQQALLAEIAKTVHMEQTLKLVSNSQAVALATVEATGDEFAKKYPDAGSLWAVRVRSYIRNMKHSKETAEKTADRRKMKAAMPASTDGGDVDDADANAGEQAAKLVTKSPAPSRFGQAKQSKTSTSETPANSAAPAAATPAAVAPTLQLNRRPSSGATGAGAVAAAKRLPAGGEVRRPPVDEDNSVAKPLTGRVSAARPAINDEESGSNDDMSVSAGDDMLRAGGGVNGSDEDGDEDEAPPLSNSKKRKATENDAAPAPKKAAPVKKKEPAKKSK